MRKCRVSVALFFSFAPNHLRRLATWHDTQSRQTIGRPVYLFFAHAYTMRLNLPLVWTAVAATMGSRSAHRRPREGYPIPKDSERITRTTLSTPRENGTMVGNAIMYTSHLEL